MFIERTIGSFVKDSSGGFSPRIDLRHAYWSSDHWMRSNSRSRGARRWKHRCSRRSTIICTPCPVPKLAHPRYCRPLPPRKTNDRESTHSHLRLLTVRFRRSAPTAIRAAHVALSLATSGVAASPGECIDARQCGLHRTAAWAASTSKKRNKELPCFADVQMPQPLLATTGVLAGNHAAT